MMRASLVLFCMFSSVSAAASIDGVRLISSTQEGVVLEADWRSVTLEVSGRGELGISAGSLSRPMASGLPDLPAALVHVGLPPGAAVSIRAVPEGVRLIPGRMEAVSDTGFVRGLRELPREWYVEEETGWLRHQRVMALWLFPVISAGGGSWSLAERVRLHIEFSGGKLGIPPPPEPSFEPAYRRLLNYEQAKRWRTRPDGVVLRDPVPQPEDAAKIYVEHRGICLVTGDDLEDAFIDLDDIDLGTLRLSNRGMDVPYILRDDGDQSFDVTDSLLFFAHPNYRESGDCRITEWWDHFQKENVYWLSWGDSLGSRYAERAAEPYGTAQTVTWHVAVAHAEEELTPFLSDDGQAPWPTEWFWQRWSSGPNGRSRDFDIVLDSPMNSERLPRVMASLHGYSSINNAETQHHTRFYLNNTQFGDTTWGFWNGRVPLCYDTDETGDYISPEWMNDGTNTLTVQQLPDTDAEDLSTAYFNSWSLEYSRHLRAVNDTLEFSVPAEVGSGIYGFVVTGVESSDLVLLDLVQNEVLTGWELSGDTLVFETEVGDSSLFFLSSFSRLVRPTRVVEERPADPPLFTGEGQASYVIITYDPASVRDDDPFHNLYNAALELRTAHQESVETRVIDVQDIYDEFNYGVLHPTAIRDFLAFAAANWQEIPLEFVLLFGDGSWDYLGYSDNDVEFSYIPCFDYPVNENYFAAVTGDDNLPDLHLGRLTVEDAAQADNAVSKIVAYTEQPYDGEQGWRKRAIMVVGGFTETEQMQFQGWAEGILNSFILPPPFIGEAAKIYRTLGGYQPGYYNRRVIDAIDDGSIIINYIGHGAALTWGIMFDAVDILEAENDLRMPVAMGLTCNSGAFAEPDTTVLGEYFLRYDSDRHGAIGFLGSTAQVSASSAVNFSEAFCEELTLNMERRLGPLTTAAKLLVPNIIEAFAFLGDPLAPLMIPTGPDLVAFDDSLWVTPSSVGELHDVLINAVVKNQGRADSTVGPVLFSAGPPGEEDEVASPLDTVGLRLRSTYGVPWNTGEGLGPKHIVVALDPDDIMSELLEGNNTAETEIEALLTPPVIAAPFDAQVVSTLVPGLAINNLSPPSDQRTYEYQIARIDSFYPDAPGFQSSGSIPEAPGGTSWGPAGIQQGATYFWRCKAMEGSYDGAWSETSSFTSDTTSVGFVWEQGVGGQFAADSLSDIVVDRILDLVHLASEINPTDYAHIDQGADVIYVSSVLPNPNTDPNNLIGADISNGGPAGQYIFGNNDFAQEAVVDLGQIRTIGLLGSEHWIGPSDRPVWSFYRISSSVDNIDFEEWGTLGPFNEAVLDNIPTPMFFSKVTPSATRYLRFEFGEGYENIPGGARWGSRVYEVYAYSVDYLPYGTITSTVIGPGASWDQLEWDRETPDGTQVAVSVLVSSTSTGPFDLVEGLSNLTASPVDLSEVSLPYVRLRAMFSTGDATVTPELNRWSVAFDGAADVAFEDSLTLTPPLPVPGEVASLTGLLVSKGVAGADTVVVDIADHVDAEVIAVFDTVLTSFTPGARFHFSVPWVSSRGRHVLTATAQVRGASEDVAPADNTISLQATILPDPAFPDTLVVLNSPPDEFSDVELAVALKNLGPAESDSMEWRLAIRGFEQPQWSRVDSGVVPPVSFGDSVDVAAVWPGGNEPGFYRALLHLICPDAFDQITEANDSTRAVIRILRAADLEIERMIFSNPSPAAGDPVGLMVHVANTGEASAESTAVVVYQWPPDSEETLLTEWGDLTVLGLDSLVLQTEFPTADSPGWHRFRVMADPESLLTEPDEFNNLLMDSLFVQEGVDLFCLGESLAIFPDPVLTRDTVVVTATVRNTGEHDAGPFSYLWEAENLQFLHGDETAAGLSGTSQVAARAYFMVPSSPDTASVALTIDSANTVPETNEDNNSVVKELAVLAEPDLLVRSDELRFVPSAPTEGDTVTVKYVIRNSGDVGTDPFVVRVRHKDGESDQWAVLSDSLLPELDAGLSFALETTWLAENHQVIHWFAVLANPDSLVREATLANNTAQRSMIVAPRDREPPLVELKVALEGFQDSTWVPQFVPLFVMAADSGSGIDTSTVNATVNNVATTMMNGRWDELEPGRWRLQGVIQLEPGMHRLRVQAADSAGNIGLSQQTTVQVAEGHGSVSVIVMSRPGADETVFVVRSTTLQKISLWVYPVRGRPVTRMEETTTPPLDSSLRWDRRDGDGDRVSNGVYLYQLSTETGRSVRGSFAIVR